MIGGGAGVPPTRRDLAWPTAGVLFLDEMGEFAADVLDSLRTPLEEGVVRVRPGPRPGRRSRRAFLLVGGHEPVPVRRGPAARASCRCSDAGLLRYSRRLSGPLLDRFDLRIEVTPPDPEPAARRRRPGESSAAVAERVAARARAGHGPGGRRATPSSPAPALDERRAAHRPRRRRSSSGRCGPASSAPAACGGCGASP